MNRAVYVNKKEQFKHLQNPHDKFDAKIQELLIIHSNSIINKLDKSDALKLITRRGPNGQLVSISI